MAKRKTLQEEILSGIDKILESLATKDDQKDLSTKQDLKNKDIQKLFA